MTSHILGIGAATWDHIVLVPEFPCQEGVTQALATVQQGGGPVATALCALASLGSNTVLLDAQGGDEIGRCILEDLKAYGVNTGHVRMHSTGGSAKAHILVRKRDGARHIFFIPATCPELQPEEVDNALVQSAALLHLNGRHESAARKALNSARDAGVMVSFDGGANRYRDGIRDLVLASDLRILAKDFALKFSGEATLEAAASCLLSDRPLLLIITDGVAGSHVWSRDDAPYHQPAFLLSDTVDTTGCGDVFHGAFLHGWLQKWPIRQTTEFAAKLAAETARGLGGRCALKTGNPTPP